LVRVRRGVHPFEQRAPVLAAQRRVDETERTVSESTVELGRILKVVPPRSISLIARASAACAFVAMNACHARTTDAGADAVEPSAVASASREDYALFAQRCSKCHSLARPLDSGITDDDAWAMYVARMRRQPGSGISEEDARAVLRVLHAYSAEARRQKPAASASSETPDAGVPEEPR
jgi:hypothetical protein